MSGKLRIGIIGCGGIARTAHIPAYQRLGDQVEIVAVCDADGERARQVAAEVGGARWFEDLHAMVRDVELDVVSVCTPNYLHAEATIAALEAGANVLCEKPPAMNAQEAQAMAEAARRTGRLLSFGFHQRFRPDAQMVKRFIEAGELGRIYIARARALRRRRIPGWGQFHLKDKSGGGPLIDIGVHVLDLCLWLMGFPAPVEVCGQTYCELAKRPIVNLWGAYDRSAYSVEDAATGYVRFEDGATLLLETSWALNIAEQEVFWASLLGTEGGAELFPTKIAKEMHGTLVDLTPAWLPRDEGHAAEIAHFVRAARGEVEPVSTPEQGVLVQRLLDALYRSAEIGAAVRLD